METTADANNRRLIGAIALGVLPIPLWFVLNYRRPDLLQPMLDHVFGYAITMAEFAFVIGGVAVQLVGALQKGGGTRIGIAIAGFLLCTLPALLMVIFSAGTAKTTVAVPALDKPASRIQVLPIGGDTGWPRLSMRLLFEFFWRAPPLVPMAKLPATTDGALPVDIAECWAVCYWAACAVQSATDHRGVPFVAAKSRELAVQVYGIIGLDRAAAESGVITSVMQALSERHAIRLGVDADKLHAEHLRLAAGVPRQL